MHLGVHKQMIYLLRLLALFSLLFFTSFSVFSLDIERMVMPGQLSNSHSKYEKNCETCHQRFDKAGQDKLCLDCHKEIAADVKSHQHIHGTPDRGTCNTCHKEHKGRNAKLSSLDPKTFDHSKTEFKLSGGHVKPKCESCHKPSVKHRDTPHQCVECHKKDDDAKGHKGALGDKCDTCHSDKNWTDTVKFDHDKTDFKLHGKHIGPKCSACHADNTFKHTETTCVGCHKKDDNEKGHKGKLGPKCESCHTDSGWKDTPKFDHNRTKLPLTGKHLKVECKSCHLTKAFSNTPADCFSCHKKNDKTDGHRGELGEKCESCHTDRGWKGPNTSRFDHDKSTKYKLTGGHRDAKCEACHVGGVAGKTMTVTSLRPSSDCVACHKKLDDAKGHKGRYGDKCDVCHTTKAWKPAIFNHTQDTKYPLLGRHADAKCDSCHLPSLGNIHTKLSTACFSCHEKDDNTKGHKGTLGKKCETCHDEKKWKIIFDHNKSRFPLTGGHIQLECVKCHKTSAYREAPKTCNGCHLKDDKHKGGYGVKCEACHNTRAWESWDFDHSFTKFKLRNKHAKATCQDCHRVGYTGKTPSACVSCHARDDIHDGGFGNQCEHCHNDQSWKNVPSNLR